MKDNESTGRGSSLDIVNLLRNRNKRSKAGQACKSEDPKQSNEILSGFEVDSEGNLCRDGKLLRTRYKCDYIGQEIISGQQLCSVLRVGDTSGGYPLVLWTQNGEAVLPSALKADRNSLRREIRAIRHKDRDRIMYAEAYLEGPPIECFESGVWIYSAYGE